MNTTQNAEPENQETEQQPEETAAPAPEKETVKRKDCLLYTSDAADDLLCVDLGGRRITKKKNQTALAG